MHEIEKKHYLHRLVIALQITVLKHLVLVSLIRKKCLNLENVFVFLKSYTFTFQGQFRIKVNISSRKW